jgi:hypothetical protein
VWSAQFVGGLYRQSAERLVEVAVKPSWVSRAISLVSAKGPLRPSAAGQANVARERGDRFVLPKSIDGIADIDHCPRLITDWSMDVGKELDEISNSSSINISLRLMSNGKFRGQARR